MRIVTYNIAFGFDARSVIRNAIGHFYIHVLRNATLVKKHVTSVDAALDLALALKPDILCLNEILPDMFGEQVRDRLKKEGFVSFAECRERHHPYPLAIASSVAVKVKGETVEVDLPHTDKTGGGGGTCALYLPGINTTVFAVHLGLHLKKRVEQAKILKGYVLKEQAKGRKVILAGDFNAGLEELKNTMSLAECGLEGCSLPTNTYSKMTLRLLSIATDLDHVLWSSELTLKNAISHEGRSDHLLLSCDFE